MELIAYFIDIVLHLDKHLAVMVQQYGVWIYAILFAIIFSETGFVVTPFLPGDSLLFVAGALAALGGMDIMILIAVLLAAAALGNTANYQIGRYLGPKVFQWEQSRFFNRQAFLQAHAFYERYGGITLVMARFMPFVRTFAPFVAGVAHMTRRKFTFYDVTGGLLWVCSLTTAGYLFGNVPWVKQNLEKIIWALILVPGLLALYGAWRGGRRTEATPPTAP